MRKAKEKRVLSARNYDSLLEPLVTEKASFIGQLGSRAAFKVPRSMSKDDIRSVVERVFGVHVRSVNTCNVQGKVKRSFKFTGRRAGYKKAYITLQEGETLNVVEGV